MKKWILILLGGVTLGFGFWSPPGESWKEKVDAGLLARTGAGATADFLVVLRSQAEVKAPEGRLSKEEKGRLVYERLRAVAGRTQAPLRRLLDQCGASYRSFYIVNALWVEGDRELIGQLARRPEVERIVDNPPVSFPPPGAGPPAVRSRNGVEWGIQRIGADQVWNLGFRGQGVVVGGADTGYDWQHPAISSRYRGNKGRGEVDHNYNWHDAIHVISPLHNDTIVTADLNPCGLDVPQPCDDNGHGTHTMGTMVGDDGQGNQIGVAPEARWIACRNMERGYGSPATYIECFEWFLAPTDLDGQDPDPSKAPHVINNSWGCPAMEGCNPSNFGIMEKVVTTLRAAGIVVVSSAGNSGSKCGTVRDPAAIYADVFSVGATRPDDTIANFSSRGPVLIDGSLRIKPDVAAPGVLVRSAIPDSSYASFSGTSMAGPHVAGLVALLISANPALAGEVEQIEEIIRETAKVMVPRDTCGEVLPESVPNNTYGYGRVDAWAAVQRAMEMTTGVDGPDGGVSARAFPNPASDRLTLRLTGLNGPARLELFDAAGRRVRAQTFSPAGEEWSEEVDLQGLPSGIYLYRVTGEAFSLSGKVVRG